MSVYYCVEIYVSVEWLNIGILLILAQIKKKFAFISICEHIKWYRTKRVKAATRVFDIRVFVNLIICYYYVNIMSLFIFDLSNSFKSCSPFLHVSHSRRLYGFCWFFGYFSFWKLSSIVHKSTIEFKYLFVFSHLKYR